MSKLKKKNRQARALAKPRQRAQLPTLQHPAEVPNVLPTQATSAPSFPIGTQCEGIEGFIGRVEPLLRSPRTVVYVDTSFAMWLLKGSKETRRQFVEWADTLQGRLHIPMWTFHEFYRHHQHKTLRAELMDAAKTLKEAAAKFADVATLIADQPLVAGRTEDALPRDLDNMKAMIGKVTSDVEGWDYEEAATEISAWLGKHLCRSKIVFDLMATLGQTGATRYTQDVPPGFLDRVKEDSKTKGSNKFGDLIFWEEILAHVPTAADTVVLLTRDRKHDWFAASDEPEVTSDLKRIQARWNPVPAPHPVLALELTLRTTARELVLLDDLYLGAVLWKANPKAYPKFIPYALGTTSGEFERKIRPVQDVDPPIQRPPGDPLNLPGTNASIAGALAEPSDAVAALLGRVQLPPHEAELFITSVDGEMLAKLLPADLAAFARRVGDMAEQPGLPSAEPLANKLLSIARSGKADVACAVYSGLLVSVYFDPTNAPRSIPATWDLQAVFDILPDATFEKVRKLMGVRLKKAGSSAAYQPQTDASRVVISFAHDADQRQVPVALQQIVVDGTALLGPVIEGSASSLRMLLGRRATATVSDLVEMVANQMGLPMSLIDIEQADAADARTIPVDLGFADPAETSEAKALLELATTEPVDEGTEPPMDADELDSRETMEGED